MRREVNQAKGCHSGYTNEQCQAEVLKQNTTQGLRRVATAKDFVGAAADGMFPLSNRCTKQNTHSMMSVLQPPARYLATACVAFAGRCSCAVAVGARIRVLRAAAGLGAAVGRRQRSGGWGLGLQAKKGFRRRLGSCAGGGRSFTGTGRPPCPVGRRWALIGHRRFGFPAGP